MNDTRVALSFLAALRRDPALHEALASVATEEGLTGVIRLAAEVGYVFSAEDLRQAFTIDWGMRRARYLRDEAAVDSAASTVAVVQTPASPT